MHAVVVAPSRRRLVQSAVITAGATAAALLAQGLGLVGGLLPLPATALLALAFLAVTWPAVANAFEASARAAAERTARDAERAQHIAVLHHAAHHDSLTGVLSRRGLEALVADAPTADADELHAVLFVDLDGFKPVNDEHGHAAGDALLVEAALRMGRCVRPTDRIARTGGDEFVIVMTGLVHTGVVDRVVEALRSVVCEPVLLPSGAQVRVGVSIGAAVASAEKPLHALLRSADEAMYAEKRSRRQLRPLSS
nr:GGDEF domain-containing protein [Quadrisphaera sp. RL12-1S]